MLHDPLRNHLRILPPHQKALTRIGIETVEDLLYYFPTRYGDTAEVRNIDSVSAGEIVALYGTLTKLKTKKAFHKKIPMAEGTLTDETGSLNLVWFHQAYIAKMIPEGSFVRVEGKVAEKKGVLSMSNPKIEHVGKIPLGVGNSLFGNDESSGILYPVYPETRGVTSHWIYRAIEKLFKAGVLETITDPIPQVMLDKYHLPPLKTALIWIHAPKKESDATAARKRFAFEEIFFIQLEKQRNRDLWKEHSAYQIDATPQTVAHFVTHLPFPLTSAQERSINTILDDFRKPYPMSRLLEGDVGSGKTAVAATTAYAIINTQPKG